MINLNRYMVNEKNSNMNKDKKSSHLTFNQKNNIYQ